jgi:hypothetical protein
MGGNPCDERSLQHLTISQPATPATNPGVSWLAFCCVPLL